MPQLADRQKKRGLISQSSCFGAENGTRTRDLNLGKVALYQLSYFRKMCDLLSEIAFAKIDKKNGFPNSERQKIRFFVILGCTSDVVCW
jgi:hypothetical protein